MDIVELASLIESLKGANLRRYSREEIAESLTKIMQIYQIVGNRRGPDHLVYRGRLCPSADGFPNLFDCIYPKAEVLNEFGRANYPNQPVFYGAWNGTTVFGELRAAPGQFIHMIVVRSRPKVDMYYHPIGEYEHITHSGASLVNAPTTVTLVDEMIREMPYDEHLKTILIDAFLADQFSRRAERPFEYKLTAAFANLIFSTPAGLMYPSVEVRGGMNIAVTADMFDKHYEVIYTWVFEMTNYYGYSVYDRQIRRSSCDFGNDGEIAWDSKKSISFTHSLRGGLRLLEDVPGWRMPQ